ncbi:MAG TPA: RidA family protein [Candidatus Binatia bacterium]|nr:RidA family protein [Candidatus Binatia bacterium]
MEKRFLNPTGVAASPAYTHAVAVSGGKTIFISGQVAMDEKGELVGRGDLRKQMTKVFENLERALAAAGARFEDVVKTTYYVVGYRPEQLAVIRDVRSKYLSRTHPPASTLVGVEALFLDDVLIEVEAVAVVE